MAVDKSLIKIDYSRDELFDGYTLSIFKERYLVEGETSPQDAFARASVAFADDADHAQRLYDYCSKLWFMYSTPALSNGGSARGLPISCFLLDTQDSRIQILDHIKESCILASMGGGLGASWASLRSDGTVTSSGSKTTGMIPFLKMMDAGVLAFKQGVTRRAAYAAYLNIDHPEIEEFLYIRKPTGGDANRKALNLHHAVNLTDAFMKAVKEGAKWPLIDPYTKQVTKELDARELWAQLIELRATTGEPYFNFIDTANAGLPEAQKMLRLKIHSSNLCNEIHLVTDQFRTAVCCLSSVNLEKYDEWKDTTMVADLIRMLDNVLDAFIAMPNVSPELKEVMDKARYSAIQERSLGLGAMGFHSYLQNNLIAFESDKARSINNEMFSRIKTEAVAESLKLAKERGYAPDYEEAALGSVASVEATLVRLGAKRNMHLLAVAPNASSSILCGNVSPSIEPFNGNAFQQKTENGTNIYKNKALQKLMDTKLQKEEQDEAWTRIASDNGSVQNESWLSDEEKDVFKTAFELDQMAIINLAADRQKYICQGQSVNLFINPNESVDKVSKVHYAAWKKGLKGLYYLRGRKENRADDIGKRFERHTIKAKKYQPDGSMAFAGQEPREETSMAFSSGMSEEFKQTQFNTTLPNGMEISCVGCE